MAGEKAKENKTLVAACVACGKTMSTELLTGVILGTGRTRRSVPVCQPCRAAGWEAEDAAGSATGS